MGCSAGSWVYACLRRRAGGAVGRSRGPDRDRRRLARPRRRVMELTVPPRRIPPRTRRCARRRRRSGSRRPSPRRSRTARVRRPARPPWCCPSTPPSRPRTTTASFPTARSTLVVTIEDATAKTAEILRQIDPRRQLKPAAPCEVTEHVPARSPSQIGSGAISPQPSPGGGGRSAASPARLRLAAAVDAARAKPLRYRRGVPVLARRPRLPLRRHADLPHQRAPPPGAARHPGPGPQPPARLDDLQALDQAAQGRRRRRPPRLPLFAHGHLPRPRRRRRGRARAHPDPRRPRQEGAR